MPVTLDVETRLNRASAEKVADEIRTLVKQAVHDGVQDALRQIAGRQDIDVHGDLSGALAYIPERLRHAQT
ncbi:hypothetical protein AWC11_07230 [Mycobacterium interjectum]|nr:hypothetical protein AWC11_07230 [Mycobacterium interjectum]